MHRYTDKRGVKHYFGEYSIYHYKRAVKNHYILNISYEKTVCICAVQSTPLGISTLAVSRHFFTSFHF